MTTVTKIVIIGAGRIGSALVKILKEKKTPAGIELWDAAPAKVAGQKPLNQILPAADFVFLCIPSWTMREALKSVIPHLDGKTMVVSVAKGIEEKSRKTMNELLTEVLPQNRCLILGGPMLAEELSAGKGGKGVIAGQSKAAADGLISLFEGTSLKMEYSSDVYGVSLAGVLKNIYALILGMADELGWGWNMKGCLVSRIIKEMSEIIEILGGESKTAFGPAGLGDLIVTSFSPHSRNHKAGEELVKTGIPNAPAVVKSEGLVSFSPVLHLLGDNKKKFLLLQSLEEICINKENPAEAFKKLKDYL